MNTSTQRVFSGFLLLTGIIFVCLAALVRDATTGIFDADAFARRISRSLDDPRVAAFVADQITDQVLKQKPDLVAVRPIIQATAAGLVGSTPFRAVVEEALRRGHTQFFSPAAREIALSLPDVGALIRSALASLNPALAAKVPPRLASLGSLAEAGPVLARVRTVLRGLYALSKVAGLLLLLGPLLLATAVALAPERRRALAQAGGGLVVVALVLVAFIPAGRLVATLVTRTDLQWGAVFGVWRTYFWALARWGIGIGAVGLMLAAAGGSLLEGADPVTRGRTLLRSLATVPAAPGRRVVWSLGLFALGMVAVWYPGAIATGLVILAGLGLAYIGLRELFREVLAKTPATEVHARAFGGAGRWAGAGLGLLLVAGGIIWIVRPGRQAAAPSAVMVCNGSALLCDRTLDHIVFPGTHNSMANEDMQGWLFPQQEAEMGAQLRDGVRALLFDIHAGVPTEGYVVTDLDVESKSREKIADVVGDSAIAAALRIRERLAGKATGAWEPYLCHGYCETGHFPLADALEEIREFMVSNPQEVVLMVIEDYIPPERIADAFDKSGLTEFVYTGPAGPPWPTLRNLITSNGRLVVFIESGDPGVPWLHPAFASFQETPYTFHTPEMFSCKANRGGTSGSLFQMNHWIETTPAPKPSNAAIVNQYDFLLGRARQCQRERGHLVNVLAVDFYRTGDVLRVARTLNGLDSTATP